MADSDESGAKSIKLPLSRPPLNDISGLIGNNEDDNEKLAVGDAGTAT
jgi:hypothetical protein